jgi:aspartyl-tRNA(Asn)/glutamyl-tRNA(Gln) amidotransferase subunit C
MDEKRITIDQVRHVARLARLELSAAEEQSLQSDLSAILAYVDKLNQLNTAEVEPTAQVGESGTLMRDDEITNRPAPEEMLANAPARSRNFFKVPKIIE